MDSKLEEKSAEDLQELEKLLDEPRDALDSELIEMADDMLHGAEEPERRGRFAKSEVDSGKPMAIVSYCSIMFGIPVFIAPLVMRDNEFSLHHGKAAGLIYLMGTAFVLAAFTNCALFLPLAFVCYIPALIGIYRASAGVEAGTAALGPLSERFFQGIEVKREREGESNR